MLSGKAEEPWGVRFRVRGIALVSAGALAATGCGGGSEFKAGDCTDGPAFNPGSPPSGEPKKVACSDPKADWKVEEVIKGDGSTACGVAAIKDPSTDDKQLCLVSK